MSGQYAHINFPDKNNFRIALHSVVAGLRDPELPVRVDSVFALRAFVEACKGVSLEWLLSPVSVSLFPISCLVSLYPSLSASLTLSS